MAKSFNEFNVFARLFNFWLAFQLCRVYLTLITIYDFHAMDEMEQAEAVWSGVHIGEREDEEHKVLLYQIDAFYVEVFYHKQYEVIRRMRAFATTALLEPYLAKIRLPDAF